MGGENSDLLAMDTLAELNRKEGPDYSTPAVQERSKRNAGERVNAEERVRAEERVNDTVRKDVEKETDK